MSFHSCHSLNLSETPSTHTVGRVPQAHSLDQPQPTTVGGSDKALQQPEVLQVDFLVDCADCAMSSSVSSQSSHGQTTQAIAATFEGRGLGLGELGNFAPGGDRHSHPSSSISLPVRRSSSSNNISPTSSTSTSFHHSHMHTATSSASTSRAPSASFESSTRSHTSSGIGSYSKTRHTSTVSIPPTFVTASVPTSLEVTYTSIMTINANNETTSIPTSRVASTAPFTSIGVEYQTVSLPYASMPTSASQSVSCAVCSVSSLVVVHPSLLSAHVPVPSITLTTTPFTTISSVHSTVQSSSSAVSQPSSNLDTMSNPQMGAITGGAIGGVALVGFLVFLVMRHRSRNMLYVTPYDIHSTECPPIIRPRNLKYRTGARRPDSATSESSFVQYSDAHLAEFESVSRWSPSSSIDPAVSFMSMSDEDDRHALASILPRRHRTYDLEKIYPNRMRTTNRFDSGDRWVEQVVTEDPSRDPSEELPAYPRSMKSSKSTSREADRGDRDHDDHFVLPSSYPPLPE